MQSNTLQGRILLVTGATSGIGRAVAEAFGGEAEGIALFARRALDPGASPFPSDEANMLAVPGNISRSEDVQALVERTVARFGRIDVIVNCAGVFPRGRFLDLAPEDWQSGIDTNLLGFAHLCRSALPAMMKTGYGRIVNIATRAMEDVSAGAGAYAVSKAGASVFTRAMAGEIDRGQFPDILINDLIPGPTRTGMNPDGQDPKDVVPHVRRLVTLPRNGPTGKTFFKGREYEFYASQWRRRVFGPLARFLPG